MTAPLYTRPDDDSDDLANAGDEWRDRKEIAVSLPTFCNLCRSSNPCRHLNRLPYIVPSPALFRPWIGAS